ncbi:hypothetical protein AXG93_2675s1310 [Marchantia polymorpha subsp. ruderalis]|uniref:J domain-containing protein n=1 Tax=Marchantia polymorpha subsp. ruderalis TaxID=1480154 RepID=A0A176VPY1_MARPO|nr:hypothetical protein AXG93_2675s1310 [Marchantia polymorpha subsp. ruderalis]
MDLIYDILDELSGNNPPANQSADRPQQATENATDDQTHRSTNPSNFDEELPILDATATASESDDSRTWERHTKSIQGEYCKDSDPNQNRKISKALESLGPKEGWLNLDDLELSTEPSNFPPPPRPAPTAAIPSTSGPERNNNKGKEKFVEKVTVTRRISYELVEEDVYDADDEEDGGDGGKLRDLIDISTVGPDGREETFAADMSHKAETQMRKVATAIELDLAALFGDDGPGAGKETGTPAVDPKGKGKGLAGDGAGSGATEEADGDLKRRREMEEMERAAEEAEAEFKKWAAGKEGNLRALLASLQTVLGPGSGWQPVALQDLLDGAAVRRQYRRATLLVHPDKLQQKRASPRQKLLAQKVLNLVWKQHSDSGVGI